MKKIKKLTPTLRFKEFSGNWNEVILGDISEYRNGGSYESRVVENGIYDLITLNSIGINGKLKNIHQKVNSAEWFLKKNDIVMVLSDVARGYLLGANDIIPEDDKFVLNQRMGLIRLIDTRFDSRFIHWSIISSQKYFKLHGQGSSQKNLSKSAVINYVVVHPSFEEQIQIAGFFDLLDERICIQEKIVETLEQLKKGYMQKIFSQQLRFKDENGEDFPEWEEMTFDEAISRGLIKKINPSELLPFDGNKTYLSTSSIDRYGICGDDGVVEYNTKPSRASMYPYNGSVWFAKMKDSLKVYKADEEAESKYILSTGFYGFIPNPDLLDGEFLRQTFLSEYFNLQKNQYSYGTTMAALNDEGLYAIAIIVPVLNEQKKIADMLMSIDSKIDTEKQILKNLHELKKGYLQQMFI